MSLYFSLIYKMTRLSCRGKILGYKRGLRNQHPCTSLIKIEGVRYKKEAHFYLGKRLAFVYKAGSKKSRKGCDDSSKYRVLWGRVTKSHGNGGVVRAKFNRNLPAAAMGHSVKIMLYPSRL